MENNIEVFVAGDMLKTVTDCEVVYEHAVTGDALRKLLRSSVISLCTAPSNALGLRSHDIDSENEFDTSSPLNVRFVHYEFTKTYSMDNCTV